jgi:hypothetical protein
VVYAIQNQLNKHCIHEGRMVDKKRVLHKQVASAHLILWICSDLSTARPARSAGFFVFRNRGVGKSAISSKSQLLFF